MERWRLLVVCLSTLTLPRLHCGANGNALRVLFENTDLTTGEPVSNIAESMTDDDGQFIGHTDSPLMSNQSSNESPVHNGASEDHQEPKPFDNYDYFIQLLQDSEDHNYTYALIVIGLFGLVGNSLIVLVWSRVKKHNTTAFLLITMAIFDFLFIAAMQVVNIIILLFLHEPTYGTDWAFIVAAYLSYIFQYSSVFVTLLITATRYLAVKYPFKVHIWFSKSRIRLFLIIFVSVSLLVAAPASLVACVFMYGLDLQYLAGAESGPMNAILRIPGVPVNSSLAFTSSHMLLTSPEMSTPFLRSLNRTGVFVNGNGSGTFSHIVVKEIPHTSTPSVIFTDQNHGIHSNLSQMNLSTTDDLIYNEEQVDSDDASGDYENYDNLELPVMIEVCRPLNAEYEKAFVLLSSSLLNVVPWLFVVPVNFLMIIEVKKSFSARRETLSTDEVENRSISLMIVCITCLSILAYPVCFTIQLLTNNQDFIFYLGLKAPLAVPTFASFHLSASQELLVMLSASINFLAYYVCGQRFRESLYAILCKGIVGSGKSKGSKTSFAKTSSTTVFTRTTARRSVGRQREREPSTSKTTLPDGGTCSEGHSETEFSPNNTGASA